MPAPSNLSFETQDAQPGTALFWTLVPVATYEELAGYVGEPGVNPGPWETFEASWEGNENYIFAFEPIHLEVATYDTIIVDFVKTVENFEELWDGNESYLTSLDSPEPEQASYNGDPLDTAERFEEGWDSNENWTDEFVGVGVDLTEGDFDSGTGGQQDEEFTTWAPGYKNAFTGIGTDLTAATFRSGADAFEAFVSEQAPREFFVVLATDVLTLVGTNPFVNNDKVFVTAEGTFPAPLQSSQTYYVRDTSGLTNKLSLTPGGVAIDITGTATGRVFLTGDPVLYWTEKMVTTAF